MVKIKICGITNVDDASAAIAAGADMLGFNFYPNSPRFIESDKARAIIDRIKHETGPQVVMVGVLVDESVDVVARITSETNVDVVQLHGDESPNYCVELRSRIPGRQIIKVLRVKDSFVPTMAKNYKVDAIMLDAFHELMHGGTGRTIDWNVARATSDLVPRLFLSGGLSPDNVAEGIARVRPYAVDACSSLELSPGHKDSSRMKEFVRAVRNS